METLITGAFKYTSEQLKELEELGLKITFLQNECQKIDFDVSKIEIVIGNSIFMYNDITEFKNLKYIQLTSAGLDRVPLEYIKENNIILNNARGVYSIPMAEWTILKILEIYKCTKKFYKKQEEHKWEKERNLLELYGKTATILGFGNIAQEIAKRLQAFGVKIKAVDISKNESKYADNYYQITELEEVLPESDIVIITLPLAENTKNMIDKNIMNKMKENAILVNVSRGGIIKEKDLIEEIKNGKFLGVILVVFEKEPLQENNPIWNFENVIVTPHNSFVSEGNNKRMYELILKNIRQYIIK